MGSPLLGGTVGGGTLLGVRSWITYFIQLRTAISAACLDYQAYLSLARSKDLAIAYNFSFS